MNDRVRIHKALADAGVASRRRAEQLVIEGRVAVNGQLAAVGQLVDPAADELTVDGRAVARMAQRVYLVLAKPQGVTSTVRDRHARQTVTELVPADLRRGAARLYPVGRLDRESEGLLLLTNDGDWAQRMLHPSHGVEREYAVGLRAPLDDDQRVQLERGIELEDGWARLEQLGRATAAEQRRLAGWVGPRARQLVWYRATLRQGMKRQLRRMFAAVGAPVERLVRIRFGTLRLAGMAVGDVRALSAAERRQLDALVTGQPHGAARQEASRPGLVVTIDGPGGSGKSSVGAGAARELGYRFCDTGVLYRGLTWLALERGIDPDYPPALVPLVDEISLEADEADRYVRLLIAGSDLTAQLHTPPVDRAVSRVSQHPSVRAALLPVQRSLAALGRIIMAGRDIGTVVLPEADLKLFLHVSIEERARRRAIERGVAGDARAVAQIEAELRRRDDVDSKRATAPLRQPEDATVIETEGNTLQQTVAAVVEVIRRREQEAAGR